VVGGGSVTVGRDDTSSVVVKSGGGGVHVSPHSTVLELGDNGGRRVFLQPLQGIIDGVDSTAAVSELCDGARGGFPISGGVGELGQSSESVVCKTTSVANTLDSSAAVSFAARDALLLGSIVLDSVLNGVADFVDSDS